MGKRRVDPDESEEVNSIRSEAPGLLTSSVQDSKSEDVEYSEDEQPVKPKVWCPSTGTEISRSCYTESKDHRQGG